MKHKKKSICCRNKVKHRTFNNAKLASKILQQNTNIVTNVYLCKRCGFYHIGKPSFKDDAFIFWNNIFNQMSEHDLQSLNN